MTKAFKLKSGNKIRFKEMGSSPIEQDANQTVSEGFSKNKHNYGKTTIVSTKTPKGTSYVETSNVTGRVVREGGGTGVDPRKTKPKSNTPKNYPNNPDFIKRSYDIKVPKTSTKKAGKKIAKKILKKVGSKFLGPVGIGLGVVDAISVAGHSYDEGSVKKGVKKWWDSPGILPTKPKFKKKK